MEYGRWAARYDQIRGEFGFPFDAEVAAADRLESLLPDAARALPLDRVRSRLAGHPVVIVGSAPGAGPPPVWRWSTTGPVPAIVAADGATVDCLRAGLVPAVIVTDLDGPVESEVTANRRGSLVVVHAHGDNRPALDTWVPEFPGELAGSWAGPPRPALLNVGGFTDGDRAAYLAEASGVPEIRLWGFDFDRTEESDPARRARKLAKLAWARRLLAELDRDGSAPLLLWRRDGSTVPYPDGRNATSTR